MLQSCSFPYRLISRRPGQASRAHEPICIAAEEAGIFRFTSCHSRSLRWRFARRIDCRRVGKSSSVLRFIVAGGRTRSSTRSFASTFADAGERGGRQHRRAGVRPHISGNAGPERESGCNREDVGHVWKRDPESGAGGVRLDQASGRYLFCTDCLRRGAGSDRR